MSNTAPPPTYAQVRALPLLLERTVPPEYEDANGHMNVTHHLGLHDQAALPFMHRLGLDFAFFTEQRRGIMDVEHHLRYLSEVFVGDTVAVHARMLERAERRFHGMWFLVNVTRERVANTFEFVSLHVDLDARKAAPFDVRLAATLDELIAAERDILWPAPVCGVMGLDRKVTS